MLDRKSSFILSFFIGGLIGGGVTFLLATHLLRTRSTRVNKTKGLRRDEMEEPSYEESVYCAPEGADLHYDREKDIYYSNEAE